MGIQISLCHRSWRENWDELAVFYDFPLEINRIIYTTNIIENMNGKICKYIKNKLSFPSDDAGEKSLENGQCPFVTGLLS
jgi:transposase-like protein